MDDRVERLRAVEEIERLTAERDRLAKALRAILRNPVVLKLPRDYSPMTTDTWDVIDAALQEKRDE